MLTLLLAWREIPYRSEEMVFGLAGAVTLDGGASAVRSAASTQACIVTFGLAVVFVSVNQVLERLWACRLRDRLPCRAVGRLAAGVVLRHCPGDREV